LTPPLINCEAGLVFELAELTGIYVLTPDTIHNSSSDNCNSPITYSINRDTLTCEDLGIVNVTLYAEDVSGNLDSCQTTISVIYETPPNPTVTPGDTLLCNGESPEIVLNNSFQNIKFVWTVSGSPNITGYTPIDSVFGSVPFTISENLFNNSNNVQSVDYDITPYPYSGAGSGSPICASGYDTTITIYVNPTPNVGISAPDTVICDGEITTISINNPHVTLMGSWLYNLDVTSDAEISGATSDQTGITTGLFNETLTNSDTVVHKVIYHFTPRITPDDGGADCLNGLDTTITVWVNPVPEIRVSTDTVICDGDAVTINIRNPNNPIRGDWKYDLDVTAETEIGGESSDLIDLDGTSITETLTNSDTVVHYVDYNFTPKIFNDDGAAVSCPNGQLAV